MKNTAEKLVWGFFAMRFVLLNEINNPDSLSCNNSLLCLITKYDYFTLYYIQYGDMDMLSYQ